MQKGKKSKLDRMNKVVNGSQGTAVDVMSLCQAAEVLKVHIGASGQQAQTARASPP